MTMMVTSYLPQSMYYVNTLHSFFLCHICKHRIHENKWTRLLLIYIYITHPHTHTLLNCVILGLQDALLLPWTLAIYQAFLMQHWNYGIPPSGGENSHSIMMLMLAFFFPCDVITNNYQDMHNIASISY